MSEDSIGHVVEHNEHTSRGWMESAAQFHRNEEYYRGLVEQIGEMLGDAAFTDDGGELHDSVLCAKVPELVRGALAKRTRPMGGEPAQLDIAKALRDAYGRGFMVGAEQVQKGGAPYATNDYAAKCREWIRQYMARLPGVELVARTGMAAGDWSKLMGKEQTQDGVAPAEAGSVLAEPGSVKITVSAPPGKRARVTRLLITGESVTQTVVGGQTFEFELKDYETFKID